MKPSEFLDAFNKASDFNNLIINVYKDRIIDEINWLIQNYDNINNLSNYFFNLVNYNNIYLKNSYIEQLSLCPVDKIHKLVDTRINFLYGEIQGMENRKIYNKPLKLIANELKLYNQ